MTEGAAQGAPQIRNHLAHGLVIALVRCGGGSLSRLSVRPVAHNLLDTMREERDGSTGT
jgi:hypothetical protein